MKIDNQSCAEQNPVKFSSIRLYVHHSVMLLIAWFVGLAAASAHDELMSLFGKAIHIAYPGKGSHIFSQWFSA